MTSADNTFYPKQITKAVILLAVLAISIVARPAFAGIIISTDLDVQRSGIQDTRQLSNGSVFDVDIVLELTDNTSLSSYQFSVGYDASELRFNIDDSTEFLPSAAFFNNPGMFAGSTSGGRGIISGIDAVTLGTGLAAPSSFVAARLNFTVIGASGNELDDDDVLPGFFSIGDSAFDASFPFGSPLDPTFRGSSVTGPSAIPEPSSLTLVVAASGVLLSRRRRKKPY